MVKFTDFLNNFAFNKISSNKKKVDETGEGDDPTPYEILIVVYHSVLLIC